MAALAAQVACRRAPTASTAAARYQAREVVPEASREQLRGLARRARSSPTVTLQVPGRHNVLNALACFATLSELGVRAGAHRRGARPASPGRCGGSS